MAAALAAIALLAAGDPARAQDPLCGWSLGALIQSVDLNSTDKHIEYVFISETIEHEQHAVLRAEAIAKNGVWRKQGGIRIFHPAHRVVSASLAQFCSGVWVQEPGR